MPSEKTRWIQLKAGRLRKPPLQGFWSLSGFFVIKAKPATVMGSGQALAVCNGNNKSG